MSVVLGCGGVVVSVVKAQLTCNSSWIVLVFFVSHSTQFVLVSSFHSGACRYVLLLFVFSSHY